MAQDRYDLFLEHLYGRAVQPGEDWLDLVPNAWMLTQAGQSPFCEQERQRATIVAFSRSRFDLVGRERSALFVGLHSYSDTGYSDYANDFLDADPGLVLPYLWSMSFLWRDLFARLAIDLSFHPTWGLSADRMVGLAFMWFDLWTPPKALETDARCREALWNLFCDMLDSGNRVCEAAAWHGVGHMNRFLDQQQIDRRLDEYLRRCPVDDPMRRYATDAAGGVVE